MVSQNAIGNTIADNDFSVNRSLAGTDVVTTIAHSDNTAVASNSALKLSVGGTTSTGDPYINWLITGSTTYSMGPDNSDSDTFKITNGATPSAGSTLWSLTTAGAVTHNNAYTFPTADGAANQILATDGAGNVDWVNNDGSGKVVQYVYNTYTALGYFATQIPLDDTIPQSGEGTECITLSITPTSATNYLVISFGVQTCITGGTASGNVVCALFQDATANALKAENNFISATYPQYTRLNHIMVAGTTSATTFKIRFGPTAGSTYIMANTINNTNPGNRAFGGVSYGWLDIWEVTP